MTEEQAQALIQELAYTNALLKTIAEVIVEEHELHYHRPPWYRRLLARFRRKRS